MPRRYSLQVRGRAVEMVLSHLDEYGSVYKAAFVIAPKVMEWEVHAVNWKGLSNVH